MRALPVADARELDPRESFRVLVEHFGWPDEPTQPMPLDELPAPLALQPLNDEAQRWARVLGDLWGDAP